jgi:hypothetical protein
MQVHAVLRIALAASFAALVAAEPYFNCPKGAYLNYQRRATATFDLARCAKACPPVRPQSVHPPAQPLQAAARSHLGGMAAAR